MKWSESVKRLLTMLFVAMPLTALVLTLVEMSHKAGRSDGVVRTFEEALVMVYLWGVVTAALLSLAHTYVMHVLPQRSLLLSVIAGTILGAAAGAVTPTVFTGFLNPDAILWGAFTGLVYAVLVSGLFGQAAIPGGGTP